MARKKGNTLVLFLDKECLPKDFVENYPETSFGKRILNGFCFCEFGTPEFDTSVTMGQVAKRLAEVDLNNVCAFISGIDPVYHKAKPAGVKLYINYVGPKMDLIKNYDTVKPVLRIYRDEILNIALVTEEVLDVHI